MIPRFSEMLQTGWDNFFRHTFCRANKHLGRRIRKFDMGNCPELCGHCWKIVGRWG